MNGFTKKEQHWLQNIEKSKELLDYYNSMAKPPKSDIKFVSNYIKLIELSIKYENLRPCDVCMPCKRLIRVYKTITPDELKNYAIESVILDGLYVVTDLVFLDYIVYKEYSENPMITMQKSLNIPDSVLCNTLKEVYIENARYGVGLLDTPFNRNNVPLSSNWDYQVWE